MTTIIGLKGYDPVKKEDYAILASDSQLTELIGTEHLVKSLTGKKIYNPNPNLIFANRGLALFDNPEQKNFSKLGKLLLAEEEKNKRELASIGTLISDLSPIQTNLIFANKESRNINLFSTGKEEGIIRTPYSIISGCGRNYAAEIIKPLAENELIMSRENAIYNLYDAINNATTHNDETFTGGFFNLGIISNKIPTKLIENEIKLKEFSFS